MDDEVLSKLRSQPLRDAVAEKGGERISVLVELDVPMPRVALGPKSRTGAPRKRAFQTGPIEDDETRKNLTAALLTEVLGEEPRYSPIRFT